MAMPPRCIVKAALRASSWMTPAKSIAHALGVIAPMISFTSGGSEANNLAIKSAPVERLLISTVEHPAVIEVGEGRPQTGRVHSRNTARRS